MIRGTLKSALAIMLLTVALMLGGCGGHEEGTTHQKKTEMESSGKVTEFSFLQESDEPSKEREPEETVPVSKEGIIWAGKVEWEDNSLDEMHAVINHSVKKIPDEGEIHCNGEIFVGELGCLRHENHTFGSFKKDWDGINGITPEGEEFSLKVEVDSDRVGAQIRYLGSVSGKKGCVASYNGTKNGKPDDFWFYELDEDFKVTNVVHPDFKLNAFIRSFMGDANGNFHLTYDGGSQGKNYVIISRDGEVCFQKEIGQSSDFYAFDEGRVAIRKVLPETGESQYWEANLATGELNELSVSQNEEVRKVLTSENVYASTPISDHEIAWCSGEGVFLYDANAGTKKNVYKWSNHGIIPKTVRQLAVMADGSIAILYEDVREEGDFYLLLKSTEEKKELKSITIAVSPGNKEKYEKAAAYFKKKYPSYVINVKSDYDETSLLTRLGAGSGPVLVDTALTGFEELESIWQPLDGFLEQAGLKNELIPETLEFGKIGNTTYGIVREFQIKTLLVTKEGPDDWCYEEFLDALEGHGGVTFAGREIESVADWREKYFDVLENGFDDNYYFNAETKTTIFETPDFERVLRLSQKAKKCIPSESGRAIRDDEALCESDYVLSVEAAVRLRQRLEKNGEKAVGYPTKNGARNMLCAISPIALRKTASEEEKEIAYTFLKVYLSKEAMEFDTSFLPVRKDVMEEQFKTYEETVRIDKENGTYLPDVMPELEWDKDMEFLYDLIKNGDVKRNLPFGLQHVFDEEFGEYLDGRIDGKTLDNHLKNRVWLYLEETK